LGLFGINFNVIYGKGWVGAGAVGIVFPVKSDTNIRIIVRTGWQSDVITSPYPLTSTCACIGLRKNTKLRPGRAIKIPKTGFIETGLAIMDKIKPHTYIGEPRTIDYRRFHTLVGGNIGYTAKETTEC
jgi:hypothetical protein